MEPAPGALVADRMVGHQRGGDPGGADRDAAGQLAPHALEAIGQLVAAEHPDHLIVGVAGADELPVPRGVLLGDQLADLPAGPHRDQGHAQAALGRGVDDEVQVVPVVILPGFVGVGALGDTQVVQAGAERVVTVAVRAGAAGLREDRDRLDNVVTLLGRVSRYSIVSARSKLIGRLHAVSASQKNGRSTSSTKKR